MIIFTYESLNLREFGGNAAPNFREDNISDTINRRETADPQFYIPTPYERQASPDSEGNVLQELAYLYDYYY